MASGKRPRTQRRADQRATRKLIHDRERLWLLSPGGSAERPMSIASPAAIEARVASIPCPQCEGELALKEHESGPGGLREITARCRLCHVSRTIWFRLSGTSSAN
jgi:hypothetical protein